MTDKLTKIFKEAKYEPSPDLSSVLWAAVVMHDRRVARLKLWVFSCAGLFSLAGLIPAVELLVNDLAKSGIYEYLSLLFGNGGAVVSYWKDLVFSLAESLPMTSILFALSLTFVFLLSLRYVIRQVSNIESIKFLSLSI